MFKAAKETKIDPSSTDTFVGKGSVFEGKLQSAAGIRIEGRVTGGIESEGDVAVGEHGVVEADIAARNVVIAGAVTGSVRAAEKVTITAKGRLTGDIESALLSIEEGAFYEGSSRMRGAAAAQPASSAKTSNGAKASADAKPADRTKS